MNKTEVLRLVVGRRKKIEQMNDGNKNKSH